MNKRLIKLEKFYKYYWYYWTFETLKVIILVFITPALVIMSLLGKVIEGTGLFIARKIGLELCFLFSSSPWKCVFQPIKHKNSLEKAINTIKNNNTHERRAGK